MVNVYLLNNPDKIDEQYKLGEPTKILDYNNDNEVLSFIKTIKKYDTEYDKIVLQISQTSSSEVCLFLLNYICENKLLKFFEIKDEFDNKIIHYICKTQNETCIMRILDIYEQFKLNFEVSCNDNLMPIHIICIFQDEKCVMRILDIYEKFGLNFEARAQDYKPIHIICRKQNQNCVMRILDIYERLGLNFEVYSFLI